MPYYSTASGTTSATDTYEPTTSPTATRYTNGTSSTVPRNNKYLGWGITQADLDKLHGYEETNTGEQMKPEKPPTILPPRPKSVYTEKLSYGVQLINNQFYRRKMFSKSGYKTRLIKRRIGR